MAPHRSGDSGPTNFSTSNISPIHSSIHGWIHDTYGTEPGILRNEKMLPATLPVAPAPAGPRRSFISGNASESHAERPAAAVNNSSSVANQCSSNQFQTDQFSEFNKSTFESCFLS